MGFNPSIHPQRKGTGFSPYINPTHLFNPEKAGAFRLLNTSLQSKGLGGMGFNPSIHPRREGPGW
jgi:hypothetical protein